MHTVLQRLPLNSTSLDSMDRRGVVVVPRPQLHPHSSLEAPRLLAPLLSAPEL